MRGCERKIIMLKGTDSEIFDEAYFLIRRDFKEAGRTGEIVREAQRIVDMNTVRHGREKRKKKERAAFFIGLAAGLAVGVILLIIF
ncbi:MAG: hypothetical protein IJN48_01660 [Clostridia bacterium]|nr:hypothetical protein [Clostridia bacterium]